MTFTSITKFGLAGLIAMPAMAFAAVSEGDKIGTTESEIRASLEAKGYVVTEIEFEDDEIEVEAIYEGQEIEIELTEKSGVVVEIEVEDD